MSKNAQAIQTNFERMQVACDIESIKRNARRKIQRQDEQDNQSKIREEKKITILQKRNNFYFVKKNSSYRYKT